MRAHVEGRLTAHESVSQGLYPGDAVCDASYCAVVVIHKCVYYKNV